MIANSTLGIEMKTVEYKDFQIQIHGSGGNFYAEVHRRGKLLHTITESKGMSAPFQTGNIAAQEAREWIDRTYKNKIDCLGEV